MTVFRNLFRFAALCGFAALAACAQPVPIDSVNDPYEAQNRSVHGFNKAVDRAVVRPVARAYGAVMPDKGATAINHFAFNFSEPRIVVNSLLQANLKQAADSSLRFIVNTTLGLGGLFDMAELAGVGPQSTDFGETLYIWGIGEGAYIELPLVGPSTTRHTVGRVVDLFANPLSYILPVPENYLGTASSLAWALDTRDQFSGTVDDILDNSADSYSQTRILYLQSRRHKLGGADEDTVIDPFEELGLE